MRRALEKEAITSQAMTVTGRAKISVAYSMVVTPPATSIAMVSTAVRTAQKTRSHSPRPVTVWGSRRRSWTSPWRRSWRW
ncbi:hypothetical protein SHIRM173S_05608 [Streptomyces hirsutus]